MRGRIRYHVALLAALALGAFSTLSIDTRAAGQAAVAQAPARLASATDQFFSSDGVTLRYKEAGSGDPVVLIHGYTAALENMLGLGEPLTSSHRVVTLDVRGFGKSSKFPDPSRFGQRMVEDVVHLMDHLKIGRAHLVGHSMGALIAANVAARYPARVTSATLIAGPFYAERQTFARQVTPWVTDLEAGKGLGNFIQWLFPRMEPKMAAGFGAQAVKSNDLPSLIGVLRSLPDLAIAALRSDHVSSLVAVGTDDPLHPLSVSFAKASAGARLLELQGADHVNVAANPETTKAMRELMQRAGAGTKQ
jgi:pimeloyl-ACP methyl ester carboxylesterase